MPPLLAAVFGLLVVLSEARQTQGRPLLAFAEAAWLDQDALGRLSEKEQPTLVIFHAYTKPSKSPVYRFLSRLGTSVKKRMPHVRLYSFDCFDKPLACADLGVVKYPSLMLFAHRARQLYRSTYSSRVFFKWLDDFANIHASPALSTYHLSLLLQRVRAGTSLPLVFFCGDASAPLFKQFDRLSQQRDREVYMYSSDDNLRRLMSCSDQELRFVSRETSDSMREDGKADSVERFVLSRRYPHVRTLDRQLLQESLAERQADAHLPGHPLPRAVPRSARRCRSQDEHHRLHAAGQLGQSETRPPGRQTPRGFGERQALSATAEDARGQAAEV